jgi:hypothetical protein
MIVSWEALGASGGLLGEMQLFAASGDRYAHGCFPEPIVPLVVPLWYRTRIEPPEISGA